MEHLSFKGTQRRSRVDIEKEIENMGAHLNAYFMVRWRHVDTQVESKLYTTRGVSTRTWVRRWIFLVTFCSTQSKWQSLPSPSRFDTAAVNNERRTILLEADDVFQNKYEVVFDLLHETAYQGCGLGLTILGPESNIKKCGLSSLFTVGLRATTSSTTFTRTTPLPAWWLPEPAPSTTKT